MGTCVTSNSWNKQKPNPSVCSLCNTCLTCNNKTTPICEDKETLCNQGKESASAALGPANAPTVQRDQIIIKVFSQSTLNDLIDYVKKAANLGGNTTSPTPSLGPEDRDFVYADKIMELIEALKKINPENDPGVTVERDQVIYADTINKIMEKINNLKVSQNACDMCNASANAACTSCQSCDSQCQLTCNLSCQTACELSCQTVCQMCLSCNYSCNYAWG